MFTDLVDLLKLLRGLCCGLRAADSVRCGGSGIRVDRTGADPEVSRRLSAEPAIVRQLQGCATPGLFGVYSAASAKCSGRAGSIV